MVQHEISQLVLLLLAATAHAVGLALPRRATCTRSCRKFGVGVGRTGVGVGVGRGRGIGVGRTVRVGSCLHALRQDCAAEPDKVNFVRLQVLVQRVRSRLVVLVEAQLIFEPRQQLLLKGQVVRLIITSTSLRLLLLLLFLLLHRLLL